MKIAVYHNQPAGGARRALYELSKGLTLRSDTVDVFTLETADEAFLSSGDFARDIRVFPYRLRSPIRFLAYVNDVRRVLDYRDMDRVCRKVAADIDAGGYDVALVDVCRFLQAPPILMHLTTPSAYYCHEPPRRYVHSVCDPGRLPLTAYERARMWWHWPATKICERVAAGLDRRSIARANLVLTNSQHTRKMIAAYYGRQATVCPLGVDSRHFSPDGGEAGDYVLSVGRLSPHKGFDFLVRSLALIPAASRPRMVIAGDEDDSGVGGELRSLADSLGVHLDIMVRVGDDELAELYRRARAFVYAPYEEPFGLVVLEAMACARPVVAVGEGGPMESVIHGETGLLVPRDERAFAETLSEVLADGDLAASLGRQGRLTVERQWTWEAAAERLEEHLAALAGRVAGDVS